MEAVELIIKERFANDQRRVLDSMTPTSLALVETRTRDLKTRYEELERTVGRDVVARVYSAVAIYFRI